MNKMMPPSSSSFLHLFFFLLISSTTIPTISATLSSPFSVPYAKQPLQRFTQAELLPFNTTTQFSRSAATPPPRCPQVQDGKVIGTEDCLYLNIYTPPSSDPSSPLLKPVLVFIHGGSFIIGSIDSPFLDGTSLASSQDIVVVTINYRLGALGFLTHPDIPTLGNLGLLDQQLALKWVQKYIHHFGGDPAQITLGGQSAGGYSACLHMVIEQSRELLDAVIMQSGGCVALPLEEGLDRTRRFAEAVGCNDDDDHVFSSSLECLREVPLDVLVKASDAFGQDIYHYWNAVVDGGSTLPSSPATLLKPAATSNTNNKKPLTLLLGFNQDEGTLFLPATGLEEDASDAAYIGWIESGQMEKDEGLPPLTKGQRKELLQIYPPTNDAKQNLENAARIVSDCHYKCPSLFVAGLHAQAQAQAQAQAHTHTGSSTPPSPSPSTYAYLYKYFQDRPCNPHPELGAFHGSNMPFLFDYARGCPCHSSTFTPSEANLRDAMQGYWGALVRSRSSPNDGGQQNKEEEEVVMVNEQRRRHLRSFPPHQGKDVVEWPLYEEKDGFLLLQLDANNVTVVPRELERECRFWDSTDVYSK